MKLFRKLFAALSSSGENIEPMWRRRLLKASAHCITLKVTPRDFSIFVNSNERQFEAAVMIQPAYLNRLVETACFTFVSPELQSCQTLRHIAVAA